MKALNSIHRQFGAGGSYVMLKLQMLAAKKNKIPVSVDVITKWADEWRPTEKVVTTQEPRQFIRNVIQYARDNGILSVIQTNKGNFLSFTEDYIPEREIIKIKHSLKAREASVAKSKPANLEAVENYMAEIGFAEPISEALKFWDYWEERGWRRKTGAIKDWQATVRNWYRNNVERKEVENKWL